METVIIKTFDSAILAHITSDKLTNAGIENFIFDEHTSQISAGWSFLVGGIKIAVDKNIEQKARQALFDIEEEYRKSAVCPKCGASEIISIPEKSPQSFLISFFTGMFGGGAVAGGHVYHCKKCGFESKTLPEPPEDHVDKDLL